MTGKRRRSAAQVLAIPALLFLLSIGGLLLALNGAGNIDLIAQLLLCAPLVVIAAALAMARRRYRMSAADHRTGKNRP